MCVFQGPEFVQFLQQDYLPSLQVTPEISQVRSSDVPRVKGSVPSSRSGSVQQELCQVLEQPDVKLLKAYMKVSLP